MLRKFTVATAIAGVALGAMLAASPASASHGGDQQFNQNLQLVPVQICNAQLAVGVGAVTVPVLSPQTTGDCVNGPATANVSHEGSDDHEDDEDDGY